MIRPWLAAGLAAWGLLLVSARGLTLPALCAGAAGVRWTPDPALLLAMNPPGMLVAGWAVMLTAMMAPVAAPQLEHLRDRSAPGAWQGAAAFALAYAAVWLPACAVLTAAGLALRLALSGWAGLAVLALVALAWQETPLKARALRRGHGLPPLRWRGLGLAMDGARFGARTGAWCMAACWPAMLICLHGSGGIAAMAMVSGLVWWERFTARAPLRLRTLRPRLPGAPLGAVAPGAAEPLPDERGNGGAQRRPDGTTRQPAAIAINRGV